MKSRDARRAEKAERMHVQRVSIIGRGVSWIILQSLGLGLFAVAGGIAYSTWKYLTLDNTPKPPDPFSPAAVYASPTPPIDYSQHAPPAGSTAPVPLPAPYPPPPLPHAPALPVAAHAQPHHMTGHPPATPPKP